MDYICNTYEEYVENRKKGNASDIMYLKPDVWKYINKNPDKLFVENCDYCPEFKIFYE